MTNEEVERGIVESKENSKKLWVVILDIVFFIVVIKYVFFH